MERLAERTTELEHFQKLTLVERCDGVRLKYADYRRLGLPIVSSLVESMVKQINRRVKGTEKFWGEEGAEAILQLRADYLSDGDVMEEFWATSVSQSKLTRPDAFHVVRPESGGRSQGSGVRSQGQRWFQSSRRLPSYRHGG